MIVVAIEFNLRLMTVDRVVFTGAFVVVVVMAVDVGWDLFQFILKSINASMAH